jgi:hypothetical protein
MVAPAPSAYSPPPSKASKPLDITPNFKRG